MTTCPLEVSSDVVGDVDPQGDRMCRFVLGPARHEANRRQFRGCLEEWAIDHVRLDVVSLDELR